MAGWGPKVIGGGGGAPSIPGNSPLQDPAFSIYDEVNAVANGVETAVITWIVPASLNHIMRVEFGGKNIAEYRLKYDGVTQARRVTYWGGSLDGSWEFSTMAGGGVPVLSGTTVTVTVLHQRPEVSPFWARIQYLEIN